MAVAEVVRVCQKIYREENVISPSDDTGMPLHVAGSYLHECSTRRTFGLTTLAAAENHRAVNLAVPSHDEIDLHEGARG